MIFLNPAVLFGLLATSIPVIIHLINLRKLNRVEFSTLAFLKELQKTKIKKVKLKQWILLALRVLIIIFLVSSFARPTIESVSLAGVSSSAKTSSVIIIDNSFSMSVVTDNGSHFNQAKSTIKELIKNAQEGDEFLLISTSDKNENYNFTRSINSIENQLNGIEITDISGDLNTALIAAANSLSNSNNINKEVYLFSDFQRGRIFNDEKELQNLSELFDEQVKIYLFEFSKNNINNLAVTDFKINNQIFQKGKPISFSATVTNFSKTEQNDAAASLFINGNRMAQSNLSLEPDAAQIINLETTLNETGMLEIFVELEDDDIINDNRRFTAINIPEQIEIIIFTDEAESSNFIELALSGSQTSGNFNITKKSTDQISAINLNSYDIVFLLGGSKNINLARLKNYIKSGGEVIVMPSGKAAPNVFQNLLNEIELNLNASNIGELNKTKNYYSFEAIDFEHPLFYDMFEDNSKPKIDSPEIYFYMKINSAGLGKSIISLQDKSAFLSEYKIGNGKVMLFSVAPVLSWSNFPLKGVFAPMVNRAVYYLISETIEGREHIAGDELIISLTDRAIQNLKVLKPGSREEIINIDTLNNRRTIQYGGTETSGIYKFLSENILIDYFSINTDPRESLAEYADEDLIEDYLSKIGFNGNYYFIETDDDYNSIIYQARFGTELWRLFLLAALLLAIIEMIVAKNSKKDIAELT
ncbi:MAG: VWA domain-containing protein [Ignavibacteriae bacterium]|nr:VWA domain-containing protein [Ignavibacteriota bacterium]NOG98439.1 VWA domain-containing protein [Ignavibacteriota bacterium]